MNIFNSEDWIIDEYKSLDLENLWDLFEVNARCLYWLITHPEATVEQYIDWRDRTHLISFPRAMHKAGLSEILRNAEQCIDKLNNVMFPLNYDKGKIMRKGKQDNRATLVRKISHHKAGKTRLGGPKKHKKARQSIRQLHHGCGEDLRAYLIKIGSLRPADA